MVLDPAKILESLVKYDVLAPLIFEFLKGAMVEIFEKDCLPLSKIITYREELLI